MHEELTKRMDAAAMARRIERRKLIAICAGEDGMTAATNATPLIALDAVVIDTETTGLDPARRASSRSARSGCVPAGSTSDAVFRA